MKVTVFGATGVIGQALLPLLSEGSADFISLQKDFRGARRRRGLARDARQ